LITRGLKNTHATKESIGFALMEIHSYAYLRTKPVHVLQKHKRRLEERLQHHLRVHKRTSLSRVATTLSVSYKIFCLFIKICRWTRMTIFYSKYCYIGEDYHVNPDEQTNGITTDRNENAISDLQTMVDMRVSIPRKKINKIFRNYTISVFPIDGNLNFTFAGYQISNKFYKMLRGKKNFKAQDWLTVMPPETVPVDWILTCT
jgi:hypothetical protein